MTLPEAVDLFFAERERKLKESTVSRYRYVVRQYIQPQLGAAPLYALTEQRVADFTESSRNRVYRPKAHGTLAYCCGPFCGRRPSTDASARA